MSCCSCETANEDNNELVRPRNTIERPTAQGAGSYKDPKYATKHTNDAAVLV